MPPYNPIGEALRLLLIEIPLSLLRVPFRLIGFGLRRRQRWRALPLQQRNHLRAAAGGFLVALCIGAGATGLPLVDQPPGVWALIGAAALGMLYLVGGVLGSRGTAAVDFFQLMWWSVGVVGCLAGLLAFAGII